MINVQELKNQIKTFSSTHVCEECRNYDTFTYGDVEKYRFCSLSNSHLIRNNSVCGGFEK